MNKPDDDEPFLSRWSRMKQRAVRSEPPADIASPDAPADDLSNAASRRDREPDATYVAQPKTAEAEAPLDLEKLPRVEELTVESDIVAFLDVRVPAALRNAALARMWTLDPTIRDFIEVAENQWNWNIPGGTPFYELIEEGSGAGLSFADATSAISRSLSSPDAPPDAQPRATTDATKTASENLDQRKIERGDESHAAAQEEPGGSSSLPPTSVSLSTTPTMASQAVEAHSPHHAAAQQNAFPSRRRHGGALPG